jgi:hypothetical protein
MPDSTAQFLFSEYCEVVGSSCLCGLTSPPSRLQAASSLPLVPVLVSATVPMLKTDLLTMNASNYVLGKTRGMVF